jgi:signal transduction histidine kinase
LLRERVDAFAAQAAAQGKRISADCPPGLQATLDAPLIGRVIDNLLGNALSTPASTAGSRCWPG